MPINYLNGINKKETNPTLVSLRLYAEEHKVPIITSEGIHFLNQIIKLRNVHSILEIGTAIGYSSLNMVIKNNDVNITTIERDQNMYDLAIKNIKEAGFDKQINVIFDDALNVDEETLGTFDLIFIDAAKSQSSKFFNKYKKRLSKKGVIVTDNLLFHNLVVAEIRDKNLKQLVSKIDKFNHFVVEQDDFDTYIYAIGDGMSVSISKE